MTYNSKKYILSFDKTITISLLTPICYKKYILLTSEKSEKHRLIIVIFGFHLKLKSLLQLEKY